MQGKEKEGIPVELLQLVDCCIEIPQFGVVRKLCYIFTLMLYILKQCYLIDVYFLNINRFGR